MVCVGGSGKADLKTGLVQVDRNRAARCNELEAPELGCPNKVLTRWPGGVWERGVRGRYPGVRVSSVRGVGGDNVIICFVYFILLVYVIVYSTLMCVVQEERYFCVLFQSSSHFNFPADFRLPVRECDDFTDAMRTIALDSSTAIEKFE